MPKTHVSGCEVLYVPYAFYRTHMSGILCYQCAGDTTQHSAYTKNEGVVSLENS